MDLCTVIRLVCMPPKSLPAFLSPRMTSHLTHQDSHTAMTRGRVSCPGNSLSLRLMTSVVSPKCAGCIGDLVV